MSVASATICDFEFQRADFFDTFLEKVEITRHRLTSHRRVGRIVRAWRWLTASL